MNRSGSKSGGVITTILCMTVGFALSACLASTPTESQPIQSPIKVIFYSPVHTPTPDVFAEHQKAKATLAAESTAYFQAQPPQPTPGPIVGPAAITDSLNSLALELPAGWYAATPSVNAYVGVMSIGSYNFFNTTEQTIPENGVFFDIQTAPLPVNTTFDQWVIEQRRQSLTPEPGATVTFIKSISPTQEIELAGMRGLFYESVADVDNSVWRSIYLAPRSGQIIVIGIRPFKEAAHQNYETAMAVLRTMKYLKK